MRALLLILFAFALMGQRDPILVPEVSQHDVEVRQGFTGTELLLFGAVHATLSVVVCTPRGAWDLSIAIGVLPVLVALVFKDRRTHSTPRPPPLPPSTHLLAPVRPPDWHG